jgi:hypothetical protein
LIHFYKRPTMLRLLVSGVVLTSAVSADSSIALVFGGDGGGVDAKVVTRDNSCKGSESFPKIPVASYENQNGWVAGYHTLNVDQQNESGDIILCGGMALTESDECHMMELDSSTWRKGSCKLPTTMTHASMVSYDGSVIVSGGYSSNIGWLDTVYRLQSIDTEQCKSNPDGCCSWESLPKMIGKAVYSHCSVIYENNLVIMGGNSFDSESYGMEDVDEMKVLNMETMEWTLKKIPSPRQRFGCVKTEHNGRSGIMISGGFCHSYAEGSCDQLRLADTQFYDWENDSWEDLGKPLSSGPRDGHTLMTVQGDLLAFGGDYKGQQIDSVEKWNGDYWVSANFDLAGFGTNNYGVAEVPEFSYLCPN